MSENIYCKSVFEAGDKAIYICFNELSDGKYEKSVIDATITTSNRYMCFYLGSFDYSASGYRIEAHINVSNATVYKYDSNMNQTSVSSDMNPTTCQPLAYAQNVGSPICVNTLQFETNIPIFPSLSLANQYSSGDVSVISQAVNYNLIYKDDSWVEVVEEKNELENTVVYSSEAQLLSRRRIILAKKNILSNTCTCALEVGDTIIYECRSAFSNKYGDRYEKYINAKEIATEKNKRICMYIGNISDSSPYGIFYNLASFSNFIDLKIGGQTIYQTNVSTGATTTSTNQNYTNVKPVPYVQTTSTQFDWSTSLFRTNIPIFSTKDEAAAYASGTLDVSNAINYKKILKNGTWVSIQ